MVNFQDGKLIHRNFLNFYTPTTKDQNEKLRKQSYLPSHQKKNKNKNLGINLLKEAKDLYSKNYKTLMKETEHHIDRKIYHVLGLEELILLK